MAGFQAALAPIDPIVAHGSSIISSGGSCMIQLRALVAQNNPPDAVDGASQTAIRLWRWWRSGFRLFAEGSREQGFWPLLHTSDPDAMSGR